MLYYKLNLGLIGNKENDCFFELVNLILKIYCVRLLYLHLFSTPFRLFFNLPSLVFNSICKLYCIFSVEQTGLLVVF
jgi:hypothetical protein